MREVNILIVLGGIGVTGYALLVLSLQYPPASEDKPWKTPCLLEQKCLHTCLITIQLQTFPAGRHSGSITTNRHQILTSWRNDTGLKILVLEKETCHMVDKRTFHVGEDSTTILDFITTLEVDTVFVGAVGGDHYISNITDVLEKIGATTLNKTDKHHTTALGFIAWTGYRGLAYSSQLNIQSQYLNWTQEIYCGLTIPASKERINSTDLSAAHHDVTSGGYWSPETCYPRHRIALIIPFRKREEHLAIFLKHIIAFLQAQNIAFQIFIVEQSFPELFNRAALMNIGYLQARKAGNFDCYIFHDVDLLPENMCNLYACMASPVHLVWAMEKAQYLYKTGYATSFGGGIILRPEQMEDINGFTNMMPGWGKEDDDTWNRIEKAGLEVVRYPKEISRYKIMHHSRDKGNEQPRRSMKFTKAHLIYQWCDGLNNMNFYTLYNITKENLFTHIRVKIAGPKHKSEFNKYYRTTVKGFKNGTKILCVRGQVNPTNSGPKL